VDQKSKEVKVFMKPRCIKHLHLHLLQAMLPKDEVGGDTVLTETHIVSKIESDLV
jgi:hypothetical protein